MPSFQVGLYLLEYEIWGLRLSFQGVLYALSFILENLPTPINRLHIVP